MDPNDAWEHKKSPVGTNRPGLFENLSIRYDARGQFEDEEDEEAGSMMAWTRQPSPRGRETTWTSVP